MTDASPAVISVENLSKWYGSVVAVNDVSFEITPGVTGLLGPNGAGKTTLLKMIEGLSDPSDGEVSIFGQTPRGNPDLYRRVGVMSEHEAVYGFYTGREFVEFSAKLPGVTAVAEAADLERGFEEGGVAEHLPRGEEAPRLQHPFHLGQHGLSVRNIGKDGVTVSNVEIVLVKR